MKKILAIILVLVIVLSVGVTIGLKSKTPNIDNDKSKTSSVIKQVEEITIDTAEIKGGDAINLMKSYTNKELGLTDDERKQCEFMTKGQGEKIKNDYYIQVIATVKSSKTEGDKTTYTFDNRGVYYIRYDGKQVLRKEEDGNYTELKVKEVPADITNQHATTKK